MTIARRLWSWCHTSAGWLAILAAPVVSYLGLVAIKASFLYVVLYFVVPIVSACAFVYFFFRAPRSSLYQPMPDALLNDEARVASM